jgi:hypothetical protein
MCKITLIDFDKKINYGYLECPRLHKLRRLHMDIYLFQFEDILRKETSEAAASGNIPIVFGLHLCGTLSSR